MYTTARACEFNLRVAARPLPGRGTPAHTPALQARRLLPGEAERSPAAEQLATIPPAFPCHIRFAESRLQQTHGGVQLGLFQVEKCFPQRL